MTNLEFLKSLKTGKEVKNFLDHVHYGCTQALMCDLHGKEAEREVWKKHCLSDEYRGINGCSKCRTEFWDSEVILDG